MTGPILLAIWAAGFAVFETGVIGAARDRTVINHKPAGFAAVGTIAAALWPGYLIFAWGER